jgi:hypothetical protein
VAIIKTENAVEIANLSLIAVLASPYLGEYKHC